MEVEFRPATRDDLELLLAWRSHPKIYEHLEQQEGPLEWDEHVEWWESRSQRRDWILTIREADHWRDVGRVNVSGLDRDAPEIGLSIGEIPLWGEGLGTAAIAFGVDWIRDHGYPSTRAVVLADNERAKRAFENAGFQPTGDSHGDTIEYELAFGAQ